MCKNGWSGPEYIITLIENNMANWKTGVDIKPGDSLTPLQFVMIMIPLSLNQRDTRADYQLKKEGCKINHQLYIYG